jgi:hypothetical protein
MIPPRLRTPLLASGAGLLIALGFPDSFGLWPLRLVSEWPAELGRAIAGLLFAGQLGPLALSKAGELAAAGSPGTRAIVSGVGLAVQLAAAVVFFGLAERPQPARLSLFVLGACALVAGLVPPAASAVSVAELGAALALGLGALWRNEAAARLELQFLAGVMITAPLADLRPLLLSIGRAGGDVGVLAAATGLPAVLWGVLATAAAGAALALWAKDKPAKVSPT